MKVLKTILIILAAIVVIGAVVVAFLPSERMVERSIIVAAPPKNAFVLVNDLNNWKKWSPWYLEDTAQTMIVGENATGVGAWYTWDSKKMGKGKMTITESAENDSVRVLLQFEGMGDGTASYRFENVGENETRVTQSMPMVAQGYFDKLKIAMMHTMLNSAFDKGLANIKELAEKMPVEVEKPGKVENIRVEMGPEMKYFSKIDTIAIEGLSGHLGKTYGELMVAVGTQNLEQAGEVFAIYHLWDPENNRAVVEAAIPVNKEGKSVGAINYNMRSPENMIIADYYGPYDNSDKAHMAIDTYAKENNKTFSGSPIEIYMNDPSTVSDPMQIHTRILYPVN